MKRAAFQGTSKVTTTVHSSRVAIWPKRETKDAEGEEPTSDASMNTAERDLCASFPEK